MVLSDSLPPLIAIVGGGSEFDVDELAERFSGSVTVEGTRTIHPGIFRMTGGFELVVSGRKLSFRPWWNPRAIAIQPNASLSRAAEQLRERAEAIVESYLPPNDPIAVQLSGGRDSSLLCALAARRLASQNRSLVAITAVPCVGQPAADQRYQYDESAGALATAARYPNVEHHLLRPVPVPLASVLDQLHRQLADPIHQPVPLSWTIPQLSLCGERKIQTLLTGDDGNFTVSAGGLAHLVDVRREEGLSAWLRVCARLLREGVGLRDIVRVSIGASLPRPLYEAGRKRGQQKPLLNDFPFFKGPLRERLIALTPDNDDPRPLSAYRPLIQEVASNIGTLFPVGRSLYGVEQFCPWDDRQLFELILSLPSSLLTSAPDRRALFDRAFGDLLPEEVLRPARRGRQNVDFHAAIDPLDLRKGIERYRSSALCREYIDMDRLATALGDWPRQRSTDIRYYGFWIGQFLPSFSLASFLYTREHSASGASAETAEPLHAAP